MFLSSAFWIVRWWTPRGLCVVACVATCVMARVMGWVVGCNVCCTVCWGCCQVVDCTVCCTERCGCCQVVACTVCCTVCCGCCQVVACTVCCSVRCGCCQVVDARAGPGTRSINKMKMKCKEEKVLKKHKHRRRALPEKPPQSPGGLSDDVVSEWRQRRRTDVGDGGGRGAVTGVGCHSLR